MIGKTNTGGVGGGLGGTAALTVKAPIDVTTTVSKGDKTFTRTSGPTGTVKFSGLSTGTWNVKISDELGQQRDRNVEIKADYDTTIAFFEATINITYPVGSTVQVKYSTYTFNAPDTSGFWACKVPSAGNWVITSTLGVESDTKTVSITRDLQTENVTLAYNKIPEFTYTGDYEIVNDQDEVITESKDNWKIRFLTSGELQFSELRGAEQGIDVFLVGGGGGGGSGKNCVYSDTCEASSAGGGGGGYTYTEKRYNVVSGKIFNITIGGQTSASTFDSLVANGGKSGSLTSCQFGGEGGNGGSGGGGGARRNLGGIGGSDGSNGNNGVGSNNGSGGQGQGTTTKEFGEEEAKEYSKGGNAGRGISGGKNSCPGQATRGADGENNTGNGGSSGNGVGPGGVGGSGIVIIRNARN